MKDFLNSIISTIIFFSPLWVANMAMSFTPVFERFPPFKYLKYPLDFGKNFFDGKRLIGKTKGWNGIFFTILGGVLMGLVLNQVFLGLIMGIGTSLGDALNSFFKRRINIPSGEKLFFFDQLNYVIVGLPVVYLFHPLTLKEILIVLIISFIFHKPICWLGYKLKIRKHPW